MAQSTIRFLPFIMALYACMPLSRVGAQPTEPTTAPATSSATSPTAAASPAAASQPQPLVSNGQVVQSIEALRTSVDSLKSQSLVRDWGPVVAAILAALVAGYSLKRNIDMAREALERNVATARLAVAEKAREEERKAIREQIDGFYAPFVQLRNSSKYLHVNAFLPRRTEEERRKYSNAQGHFRTLPALIDGHKFTGIDLALLREVIAIGKKTAALIYDKSGLVDDLKLQNVLARATTHFRIMELAVEGETLVGGGPEFDKFTFPHEVDGMVQEKLDALNHRLTELQRHTSV